MLGDAIDRKRTLTKADISDAYLKAKRHGEVEFMELPAELPMTDEDGDELCIMLTSPIWGEPSAGWEWFVALHAALSEFGWRPCEAVPCMWRHDGVKGDAVLITIVDDLLFSESEDSKGAITDQTIALLKKRFGALTHERWPTSFAGYKLIWNEDGSLSLSMEQKVMEAAPGACPHPRGPQG